MPWRSSFSSRHTSIEAAEQGPPRAGPRAGGRSTDDETPCAPGARRSTTQAGGFVFAEPMASRATSIRAGGDAPDTRDSFVKPGSERPFYTAVHREPSTTWRALAPAEWADDQSSGLRPRSVSAARQPAPRLFPGSARARLTVSVPV